MSKLKYTVIKSKKQYYEYCTLLEELMFSNDDSMEEEMELIDVLIEKWDNDNKFYEDLDPIELLKYLMDENELKQKDLVEILKIGKSTVSKILNKTCGLSKEAIRILSDHFKLSQDAFNREYQLNKPMSSKA